MRGGTLSTNEILFGLGLVLLLAVGSQLVARRLGLPAIVVLLPAGFLAGVATGDVHPDALLGAAGAGVLWLLLRDLHLNAPRQAVLATLTIVVAAVVAADLLREDAGF